VESVYMLCSILFILCLGGLSTQETARKGNAFGVISMLLAIVVTFFLNDFNFRFAYFVPPFAVGGLIGLVLAVKVEMINMPEMVAALHSFVGIAATLVGYGKYVYVTETTEMDNTEKIETFIGIFIGAVTFTGSVVAFGKLRGSISSTPLMICGSGRHLLNILIILGSIYLGVLFCTYEENGIYYLGGMTILALLIGWHLVMAIGGADMPVVVSMLNSYSGWATSASGFLLKNDLLIITGALVGSSGAILSYIMCRAMNRSFFSVIMGGFGQGTSSAAAAPAIEGTQVAIDCKTFVNELQAAKSVVIVPGYGMAVARAQHECGQFAAALRKQGKKVEFCIHPVAGRLPGHMNVLLAEANVPYGIVKEMDEVNSEFPNTDISIVLGANDIVNPDALDNPNSLIAGMPVCQVWKSKRVVVFKRGGGAGYAGIENPLFVKPNTRMYFGSADKSIKEIMQEMNARGTAPVVILAPKAEAVEEHEEKEPADEVFPQAVKRIGIVKEVYDKERRVAMTPNTVKRFRRLGFEVVIESLAGDAAGYSNEAYARAGATILEDKRDVLQTCTIILKVRRPSEEESELLGSVELLVSYFNPSVEEAALKDLATKYPKLTIMAMECVPRISRAQKLDSLSSMANIAGYRAVIESMSVFQRCPKAQITAAGKLPPARVFIIGCGVAGLAAIGYCKSLGAIVKAFDTRPAAREQAESLGAEFIEVEVKEDGTGVGGYAKEMSDEYKNAQKEMTKNEARRADIIITTALIPGRRAPILVETEVVRVMRPGSVILDMAAEMGGNCELTEKDRITFVPENKVSIIGYTDLASRMAPQSSELYSTNLWHLMDELGGAANFKINMKDEIVSNMSVVHNGNFVWVPLTARPAPEPPKKAESPKPKPKPKQSDEVLLPNQHGHHHGKKAGEESDGCWGSYSWLAQIVLLGAVFVGISVSADAYFLNLFLIFVLAIVIGYMVIWNVTPALHTPLMSVTNAVSGIIVIGAMLELNPVYPESAIDPSSALGVAGVFFASINVIGGFVVTYRMLQMFQKGKVE